MFAYGALSVVLLLHLRAVGLTATTVGYLLSSIVLGDLLISLLLTTHADVSFGRRRTLIAGALLMASAGAGFAASGDSLPALWLCGTLGVLSVSGGEIGPFVPVEQAALAEIDAGSVGPLFGYYSAVGYIAGAIGAAASGGSVAALGAAGFAPPAAYRVVLWGYAAVGVAMAALYSRLPPSVEPPPPPPLPPPAAGAPLFASPATRCSPLNVCRHAPALGLTRPESRVAVAQLSALFAVDAFCGGLVMQSSLAFFFHVRWGWGEDALGALLFACSVLGGLSSAAAGHLVVRFGAVNIAVWTHLPSNALLLAVPLMPSGGSAAAALLLRFCLSQMDVPARQSLVVGVVAPWERSAASGVTNVVRSLGLAASPLLLGASWGGGADTSVPFAVAAALTTAYDLALLVLGRKLERAAGGAVAAGADLGAAAVARVAVGGVAAPPPPLPPQPTAAETGAASGSLGGGEDAPPPGAPTPLTEEQVAAEERKGLLGEDANEEAAALWLEELG
jgi:hypothetical protein